MPKINILTQKYNEAVFSLETASFLAFREVELYRTIVRRRIQLREIYLRFSASTQLDDFVIKLKRAEPTRFFAYQVNFRAHSLEMSVKHIKQG